MPGSTTNFASPIAPASSGLSSSPELRLLLPGDPVVVAVEEPYELSGARLDGLVPRVGEARAPLVHEPDALVRARDLGRAVRRAAVDDDQLRWRRDLAQDALDRISQAALAVQHGHDHATLGVLHAASAFRCGSIRAGGHPRPLAFASWPAASAG